MLKINDWALRGGCEEKGYVIPTPGKLFRISGFLSGHPTLQNGTYIKTDFVILMTKLPNQKLPIACTLDGYEFLLDEPDTEYKEFVLKQKGMC